MIKLAHRGYSEKYPENTMIAFVEAIEGNFDGIETDVHLTKDNRLVLIHDEKINRTSNGKGYVKDLTYDELCKYNFNYHFKEYKEKIPLLEELLDYCKNRETILNLEIKTNKILNILLPTMLPTAKSHLPFKEAVTEVTNSGNDVPNAITVSPINL